jgi:APA family basic amino acid/polyamine antiporter
VAEAERADTPSAHFGVWTAYFLVIASMVGAGILTTSGYTLRETGNPASLLGLWIAGGVMALCGAITLVELGTKLPHVGGDYIYVREAFGRDAGVVAGWATFIIGFAAPTAVIARLASDYLLIPALSLAGASAGSAPDWLGPAGASLLIAMLALTHGLGHQESSRLQTASTIAKISVLIAMAVIGLMFGEGDWSHFRAGGWPSSAEWPVLATGLIYVGYAYSGWNGAGYLAGEIRDPVRLLPRATIGACLTVVAIYLLINVMYVYALDPRSLTTRSPDEVKQVAELAATALFGPRYAGALSGLLGLGLVASVSAYLLAGPRVAVAMARDAVFPRVAAVVHKTRGTPIPATLMQAALAIVFTWSGSFREILDYASIGLTAIAAFVVASVFPLRRRSDLSHPYRLPLYPLPPLLFLGLSAWTITSTLLQPAQRVPCLLSLATLAAGIPIARLVRRPESP